MATLNQFVDDDEASDVPAAEQSLSWQWQTWPAVLKRGVFMLVTVLVGIAAMFYALNWAGKALTKQLNAKVEVKNQALLKVKNSDQERADIEQNLPLLRELEKAGIFGEEKRLEWIEQLRSIEKRWPGTKINYAISAQNLQTTEQETPTPAAPSNLPSGEASKKFGIFYTDMKLTLRLLHEGDALAIVKELETSNLGKFTLRQCSFKRQSATQNSATDTATSTIQPQNFVLGAPVESECTLRWISMKPYSAS